MPKVSKDSATQGGEFGPVTDLSDQVEGYTVNFVSFAQDIDASPLLKGLPDDRCQCPHWGYLLKGSFRVTYLDGPEEIVEAGEAYHLRPGHFVQTLEPVELIELSPVGEHDKTLAVVARNMAGVAS
jgi:hypothetical protein